MSNKDPSTGDTKIWLYVKEFMADGADIFEAIELALVKMAQERDRAEALAIYADGVRPFGDKANDAASDALEYGDLK